MVIKMTGYLLKKTDIEQQGIWVRPVLDKEGFTTESELELKPTASDQSADGSVEPAADLQSLARIRHVLHDLATQLAQDKQRLLEQLRPHLVELAISIARRIVAAEISQDRRIVERTVKAAMDELATGGELQVRVHPGERTSVERVLAGDEAIMGQFSNMRVIADSNIKRGGCVVESDYGIIDANLPTQFAQIQKALLADL